MKGEFDIPRYDVSDYMINKDVKYLKMRGGQTCYFTGIDTLGDFMFLDEFSDVILLNRDEIIDLFIENNMYDDFNRYIGVGNILDNL